MNTHSVIQSIFGVIVLSSKFWSLFLVIFFLSIWVTGTLFKFCMLLFSFNFFFCSLESLDELTSMVVKLFGEVENKNVPIPEFPEHPFQEEHLRVSERLISDQ